MANITAKKVLKYVLLPGIMPRISDLLHSGFGYIAFCMAQIYHAARLIPAGHPYLLTANLGRFGVRHVISEAASRLTFRRENIDQLFMFFMLLVGVALFFMQFALLILAVFMQVAHAGGGGPPEGFLGYFQTPDPTYDIAHMILDRVFGIQDFFNSCVATNTSCWPKYPTAEGEGAFPSPFHTALHGMLQLYSVGLLVVAVFIFLYFIVAVAAETAQTGTPFGRRFNHVWAPIRMVFALGLLVPIADGLNSAQWILMYSAKWGSGFATNGWTRFVDCALNGNCPMSAAGGGTEETMAGLKEDLIAQPNPPPLNNLLEFYTAVATCYESQKRMHGITSSARTTGAFLVNPAEMATAAIDFEGTDYPAAVAHFGKQDIEVRFGEKRSSYTNEPGGVKPFCGILRIQVTDVSPTEYPGAATIAQWYYIFAQTMWADIRAHAGTCAPGTIGGIGSCIADLYIPVSNPASRLPTAEELRALQETYESAIMEAVALGTAEQVNSAVWMEDLRRYGWGGAGIWYNKIAQLNGTVIGAAYNLPNVKQYPLAMEEVKKQKMQNNTETATVDRFKPYLSDGEKVRFDDPKDWNIADALYQSNKLWSDSYANLKPTGNIFIDAINLVFGTEGLFNIFENGQKNIHPLAQLTAIGRGMIDSTIRNLGWAAGATAIGAVGSLFDVQPIAKAGFAIGSFLTQVAMMGLSIGFLLYYIVPFLPFIYFFFAVGSWIKTIFEAMVGVPLWALAHIRIDGNGLPGDAAMGGYYLILEVFLRPIMIIFGMVAAIVIFTAQAKVLNETWALVISNVAGFDIDGATGAAAGGGLPASGEAGSLGFLRGTVDRFFYTAMYAIVIYMLGLSSFKLIDQIPHGILRWMNASASVFGDNSGDPAGELTRNAAIGAQMVQGQISSVGGNARQAVSHSAEFVKEIGKKQG